jgi:hypothetical protein
MRLAEVTQVQLAAAVGLTQPRISEICNGRYGEGGLPVETARRLSGSGLMSRLDRGHPPLATARQRFEPGRYYDTYEIADRLFPRSRYPRNCVHRFLKNNRIPCERTGPKSLTLVLGESILAALELNDQQARKARAWEPWDAETELSEEEVLELGRRQVRYLRALIQRKQEERRRQQRERAGERP